MDERRSAVDFGDFQGTRNFAALDGLRAASVFLVFSNHFGGPVWARLSGQLGVHAFFVLSGFLITTLLLRERDATGSVSLRAFYIRRGARLLPLYLLVLLAVLGQSYLIQGSAWEQMKAATPYYLSLLNELADFAPYGMTWTLGVEWKYYLVWPALLVAFGATARSRFATAGAGIAALAALAIAKPPWGWLVPQNYVGMLIGSTLAMLMHTRQAFEWMRSLMARSSALLVLLALLLLHRRFPVVASHIGEAAAITVYSLLVAMLIPALVAPRNPVARALAAKWLVFIGQRSYAMYLVQYLAAYAVIGLLPEAVAGAGAVLLGLSFVAALALSDLLYRWLERPVTDWGHRKAKAAKLSTRSTLALPACDEALGSGRSRTPLL
jgi:peptidoglycan/LPS O-acetylase OafA/YrhL